MASLILSIIFLIGLIVGSFLNVVILRGERGQGFGGRSRCMACRRALGAMELIPVWSFLWLGGRCRSCASVISLQYPLVEAGTALAFAAIAALMLLSGSPSDSLNIEILKYLNITAASAAAAAAIVILVSDFRFQIIPDGATLTLLIVAASRILIQSFQTAAGMIPAAVWNTLIPDVISAVIIAFFFFFLWFVSRGRWMGFGDVKLAAATSLLVGFPAAIAALLFAFWIGGAAGAMLLLTGKKALGSRMPFGPFILAGAAAAWFWADAFFAFTGIGILL